VQITEHEDFPFVVDFLNHFFDVVDNWVENL